MRQTREIPFALTAKSIQDAAEDLANSVKTKKGVVEGARVNADGTGVIIVEEDI